MTGVGCAPPSFARSRHASWSCIVDAQATWWTVPAPPIPAPLSGGESKEYVELRESPRTSHAASPLRVKPSASSSSPAPFGIGAERTHRIEALQSELPRDLRVVGNERLLVRLDDGELETQALRI